jgi:FkbM family methyltransferase
MTASEFLDGLKQGIAVMDGACRRALSRPAVIASGPARRLRFDAGPDTARFEKGDYEYAVQQTLASLARPGDVCYDIGANLGFFSILLGRLVGPTGVVHAFEPVPANAAIIKRNAHLNGLGNIRVMEIALTRRDGDAELLLAQHVGGAVLKDVGPPPDPAGCITVRIASVDTLIERGVIAPPRLAKIDVEGAEMDVLIGMERALRDYSPVVVLELDGSTQSLCESKVSECRTYLESLGYGAEPLPNSYPDGRWFVRHFVAARNMG